MMGDEAKVLAEIDDPTLGRWMLNDEGMHEAGWTDTDGYQEIVRWDGFYGSQEVRVLAALLADAVRRLSERIDVVGGATPRGDHGQPLDRLARVESRSYRANERIDELREELSQGYGVHEVQLDLLVQRIDVLDREIRRQGKDGMQDHLERKHLAEVLRRLSVRVDGIDQAVRDTRVEQGEVNLVTELDTRHAMRRLEELEERVVALEGKSATGPRDDALIQPNDTVSEATWDYIRYQVVDEIVTRLFNRDAAGRDGEAIGSQVPIADWLQREYLEGKEDVDG